MRLFNVLLVMACLAPGISLAGGRSWTPATTIRPYSITGQTGAQLYASIGKNGPVIGGGKIRAIAYTDFKLTWRRRYENRNGGCTLAAVRPKLTLIYKLPKPSKPLPANVKAGWERFYKGIVAHERHHGEIITQMVERIEGETIGIHADNDPQCRKVHVELNRRLKQISDDRTAQNIVFDKAEMSAGGTVHQLVLELVNGP